VYYVATCPICEQGLVGVRLCCRGQKPLAVCDECESIWYDPTCPGQPATPRGDESACPRCGEPLWRRSARWATKRDIQRAGWTPYVLGQSPRR